MQKNTQQLSFSAISVSKRKLKSEFFDQMNQLLDWTAIDKEIRKHVLVWQAIHRIAVCCYLR